PNRNYLDLSVDGSDQLYLLWHGGDGTAPSDYHVDVYSRDALLINSTGGMNVPHLAVDHWRSIFAPNFDALADTVTGKPYIDPSVGAAEPSVSRFDPDTPKG